jgi:hypothetical protein
LPLCEVHLLPTFVGAPRELSDEKWLWLDENIWPMLLTSDRLRIKFESIFLNLFSMQIAELFLSFREIYRRPLACQSGILLPNIFGISLPIFVCEKFFELLLG